MSKITWGQRSDIELLAHDLIYHAKINRSYDIPYLCGYSVDGSTVYFDRHIPENIYAKYGQFLMIHELTEKACLMILHDKYQEAHELATEEEKKYVQLHGYNWNKYSEELKPFIKGADKEKVTRIPTDLDIEPYIDENDKRILREIMAANGKERR